MGILFVILLMIWIALIIGGVILCLVRAANAVHYVGSKAV